MLILGIESSCDETAGAVIKVDKTGCRILSEEISSQVCVHEAYGGVVPELASRAHLQNLPVVIGQIMAQAKVGYPDLSAIGVTRGPGLKGCLLMGASFAKGLCVAHGLPLVAVNHIEAHIHAALLDNPEVKYPFLGCVVSGGHTEIIEVKGLGNYRVVARTIDDAAGEAFDKSANLLGFQYPGGAALAKLADESKPMSFRLPKVMRGQEGFSFSGLKTAIALLIAREQPLNAATRGALAAAIQDSIVDALVSKMKDAVKQTGYRQVVVSGGVSANLCLRERAQRIRGVKIFFPHLAHCMDNAAMVAYLAALRFKEGQRDPLDISVLSRWPIEEVQA